MSRYFIPEFQRIIFVQQLLNPLLGALRRGGMS
jgi:hypothetical protein